MHVREAETTDREAVRDVARRSLRTSYSFSPSVIESAVEQWYDDGPFTDTLDRSDVLVLVALLDDRLVGFAESVVTAHGVGDLRWLHVAPAHRGQRVGARLLEQTRERLAERGVDHLRGSVLEVNEEGATFYERHGFEAVDTDEVEIGGLTHVENVYAEVGAKALRSTEVSDDRRMYVDRNDVVAGTEAAFQTVYTDARRENRYGYYCSNCDALANAMDSMGRIECTECGNICKPTRWDAAYL